MTEVERRRSQPVIAPDVVVIFARHLPRNRFGPVDRRPENQEHFSGEWKRVSPSTEECQKSAACDLGRRCGLTGTGMRGIEWPA